MHYVYNGLCNFMNWRFAAREEVANAVTFTWKIRYHYLESDVVYNANETASVTIKTYLYIKCLWEQKREYKREGRRNIWKWKYVTVQII